MTLTAGRAGRPVERAKELVLGTLMLAFEGKDLPAAVAERLRRAPAAGVTLFRFSNVDSPGQIRELAAAIQAAAARSEGPGPLLVAADQEGGQLIALGDGTTAFAGNMALGAAGDEALAERVGAAVGRELRALGVNVAYAPACDLAVDPRNPAVGIRSFGADPAAAGRLVGATVRGLQAAGVAAALKHFPGIGDVAVDTHDRLAVLDVDAERLATSELVPFRHGIAAGARLVMSAHLGVPALTGDPALPSTLSPRIMSGLLRDELGFEGVSITDALDMRALAQGPNQVLDVLAALRAGVDLLLTGPDPEARARIESGLAHAAARGLLDEKRLRAAAARVAALRSWLDGFPQPELAVVGCPEHADLADELARRSITLVRDDAGLLPLGLTPGARVAAIQPTPTDQTPADTSSAVGPGLAAALAERFGPLDEHVVAHDPSSDEIAAVRAAVADRDLVVVGTTAALTVPGQAALVDALLGLEAPLVTVALRTPFDLAAYPRSRTHVATYGILPPTLRALAAALAGEAPFEGRLPAAIPGLHPTGHGILRPS